jgi:Protein of unknown function (DUF992)
LRYFISACATSLALVWSESAAAQRMKAGLLTCDVSAGIGYIIGSHKDISCVLRPDGSDRREDYDGSITKFGLDAGITGPGRMIWVVFTDTVAGPGFLAGDYVGASAEVSLAWSVPHTKAFLDIPDGTSRPSRWRGKEKRSARFVSSLRIPNVMGAVALNSCTSIWRTMIWSRGGGIRAKGATPHLARNNNWENSSATGSILEQPALERVY